MSDQAHPIRQPQTVRHHRSDADRFHPYLRSRIRLETRPCDGTGDQPGARFSPPPPHSAELFLPPRALRAGTAPQARAANVLIFDADPLSCAALARSLNAHGHAVALACTPDLADHMLRTYDFTLVVCDYDTPTLDAADWVKRLLRRAPCPIVLLSRRTDRELGEAIRPAALAACLTKPVNPGSLDTLVRQIVSRTAG